MKKIIFNRYANKLQRNVIDQLTEIQRTIEVTFTDIDIDIFITQNEVCRDLCRIRDTYENYFCFITEYILNETIEMLSEDDEDDISDVIHSLVQTYLLIEDIKFSICTPELTINETALKHLHDCEAFGANALEMADCVITETTNEADNDEDENEE